MPATMLRPNVQPGQQNSRLFGADGDHYANDSDQDPHYCDDADERNDDQSDCDGVVPEACSDIKSCPCCKTGSRELTAACFCYCWRFTTTTTASAIATTISAPDAAAFPTSAAALPDHHSDYRYMHCSNYCCLFHIVLLIFRLFLAPCHGSSLWL